MFRILELGCGKGRHTEYLRKKFSAEVHGIDISETSINLAKASYPEIHFAVMAAERLDFPDQNFDQIYGYDVLEHVDDLESSVSEINRVIKSGGLLVINVPAPRSEAWLAKIRPSYAGEMHHVRIFQPGQMEQIFGKLGFKLKTHKAEGFTDHLILYYVMTRNSAQADEQLGIGNWRDSWLGIILFGLHALSKPNLVFESELKYIPAWLFLIPLAWLINLFGNRFMPKSLYYEFIKS